MIRLLDLAARDADVRFSPFCWRTKMCLKHKRLDFETLPWRFTEKARLAATGSERVPVIEDRGAFVHDSWTIALHLDQSYPERPLMADARERAAARLAASTFDMALHPALARCAMLDIHRALSPEDQAYFRASREQRIGTTLEALCADPAAARKAVAQVLAPVEQTLADHTWLGGTTAGYADYALFGSLMWTHVVCPEPVVSPASRAGAWFERMLDLHDGYARRAKRAVT